MRRLLLATQPETTGLNPCFNGICSMGMAKTIDHMEFYVS